MVVVRVTFVALLVCAGCGRGVERAGQEGVHQLSDRGPRSPGMHADAVFGEQPQGAPADASRDHDPDPLVAEPDREEPRPVFRSRDIVTAEDGARDGVHVHNGERPAAAEVSVQAVVVDRNGDFHQRFNVAAG